MRPAKRPAKCWRAWPASKARTSSQTAVTSRHRVCSFCGTSFPIRVGSAHGLSFERNPDGVVNDAVHNGVGVGGIADHAVPAVYWKLAGKDDRRPVMPVIDDLHEIAALGGGQVEHGEVVNDQEANLDDLAHQLVRLAVKAGCGEIVQQARQTRVENAVAFPRRLVAQRAGEPTLARAGRPGDGCVAALLDPTAGEQVTDHDLVQPPPRLHNEVLKAGGLPQAGLLKAAMQSCVGAVGRLAVNQQRQLLVKVHLSAIEKILQLFKGARHAIQPHFLELFYILVMHALFSLSNILNRTCESVAIAGAAQVLMKARARTGGLYGSRPAFGEPGSDVAEGMNVGAQSLRRGGLQRFGAELFAERHQSRDLPSRLFRMVDAQEDLVGQRRHSAANGGGLFPHSRRRQPGRSPMLRRTMLVARRRRTQRARLRPWEAIRSPWWKMLIKLAVQCTSTSLPINLNGTE